MSMITNASMSEHALSIVSGWGDLVSLCEKKVPEKPKEKKVIMRAKKRYYLTGEFSGIYLTSRQYDILKQFLLGENCQAIADMYELSLRTVEEYSKQIRKKLGFSTKAAIIRHFLGSGYVQEFMSLESGVH